MTIYKKIFVFAIAAILLLGLVFDGYFLLQIHDSYEIILLVVILTLLALLILYVQFTLASSKEERDIAMVAKKIDMLAHRGFNTIATQDVPAKVLPLVTSLNTVLGYLEDRYNNEQDFTSNASHELRTPLSGIRLQTEIALKTKSPDIMERSLCNILKAVDRGTRMVEQLLILSRLNVGEVHPAMEAVNMGRVTARCLADLIDLSEKKHISLTMQKWDDCYIEAYEDIICIMIHNIVRNSIYYCPTHSKIDVSVKAAHRKVTLTIIDNGPGIPKDKYEHVLGRLNKAKSINTGGTGLGLAIVKRIIQLHDATLQLDEGYDGKGLKTVIVFDEYDNVS